MKVKGIDIFEDYEELLKECNRLEAENAALKELANQANSTSTQCSVCGKIVEIKLSEMESITCTDCCGDDNQ